MDRPGRWRRKLRAVADGRSPLATRRTFAPGSFTAPLIIRATLNKTDYCSNHYIKLSTSRGDQGGASWYEPGGVTFWWLCDHREINGQTDGDYTYCSEERMYDIEITVVDLGTVTFRDAAGTCGDCASARLLDAWAAVVYVGRDTQLPLLRECPLSEIPWKSPGRRDASAVDDACADGSTTTAAPSPSPTITPAAARAASYHAFECLIDEFEGTSLDHNGSMTPVATGTTSWPTGRSSLATCRTLVPHSHTPL